jgi:hypothetical protein
MSDLQENVLIHWANIIFATLIVGLLLLLILASFILTFVIRLQREVAELKALVSPQEKLKEVAENNV